MSKSKVLVTPALASALLAASCGHDGSAPLSSEVYPLANDIQQDATGRIAAKLPARMPDGSVLCRYEEYLNAQGETRYWPITHRFEVLEDILADDPVFAAHAGTSAVRNCDEAERVDGHLSEYRRQSETEVSDEAGGPVQGHDKIVSGQKVDGAGVSGQWQGIVRLGRSPGEGGMFCSGAFITDRHIITAAHCFPSSANVTLYVYAPTRGESKLTGTVERHPSYTGSQWSTDIAVVTLDTHDSWAASNHFAIWGGATSVGKNLYMYGYGVTSTANTGQGTLRTGQNRAPFRIDSHSSGYFKSVAHTARSCSGDSGGPAIDESGSEPVIWGVLKGGTGGSICTPREANDIWTKTTTNLQFINSARDIWCAQGGNVVYCSTLR